MSIKAELKKSDGQININKSRVIAHLVIQKFILKTDQKLKLNINFTLNSLNIDIYRIFYIDIITYLYLTRLFIAYSSFLNSC